MGETTNLNWWVFQISGCHQQYVPFVGTFSAEKKIHLFSGELQSTYPLSGLRENGQKE